MLLVEDDPAICEMYCLALRLHGFLVETAECGEEAVALALAKPPDVVLLDIGLPDRSGIEVLVDLKGDPRTAAAPVLMFSNFSEPDVIARALDRGATAYVVKAETTPKQVAETLGRILAADVATDDAGL
ncbi:MAG: response regulator transcription factor [Candidatus Dormibacteria bacterium]